MLTAFQKIQQRSVRTKSGCLEWIRGKNSDGYGIVWDGQKQRRIHRVAYEHFKGAIPKGLDILHKCGNPPCWEEKHLYAGTDKDNAKDRDRHRRTARPWLGVKGKRHPAYGNISNTRKKRK